MSPDVPGYAQYAAARSRAIGGLRGRVLEVGAGEGSNFGLLAPGIEWIGLEPSRRRRSRLRPRAVAAGHRAPPLDGFAEAIPLPNASVDGILATVVLCSVRDQERSLAEFARVLVPGGRVVLTEHVAAPPGTGRRWLQGLVSPVSRALDHGCDPTRDTEGAVRRSALVVHDVAHFEVRALGRLTVPFVVIEAGRSADRGLLTSAR